MRDKPKIYPWNTEGGLKKWREISCQHRSKKNKK